MVERLSGVREVVGLIPGGVIPKTLKMVLGSSLLSPWYFRIDQGHIVGSPIVDCKM